MKRTRRPRTTPKAQLAFARRVLDIEARAISAVGARLNGQFLKAVKLMDETRGRVVVTAIGKPGFIAQKLSATLASVGVPSLFLHPAEAAHGDLGRVAKDDVVLALSNSGATEELLRLLPPLKRLGVKLVAITGEAHSPLAEAADLVIDIGVIDEACPMGLVPTASSAALHAVSDALALTLALHRDVSATDYAQYHPGGKLGRSVMRVGELMRKGAGNPVVKASAKLSEAVVVMTNTRGRPGAANVVDRTGRLVGIFTDGDLRRLAEQQRLDFSARMQDIMCKRPRCVGPEDLVLAASAVMREARVDQLPVVDREGRPVGLLDVQDLLAARAV